MKMAGGAWGIAAIVIVLASWFLYRFLAPKSWRQWLGAGLVQAFIIAFYAEMYGFPLTMYVLVRFFGLDTANRYISGNLWSNLLGYGETGMTVAMLAGMVFLVVGISLVIEGWRELYRAAQEKRLETGGLYGIVRHPQYTGIFLALFGEGVVHWPTFFSVGLFPVIVVAYVLLARREEKQMIEQFGREYLEYRRRVPMFFPRWGNWGRLVEESVEGESGKARREDDRREAGG